MVALKLLCSYSILKYQWNNSAVEFHEAYHTILGVYVDDHTKQMEWKWTKKNPITINPVVSVDRKMTNYIGNLTKKLILFTDVYDCRVMFHKKSVVHNKW